jgi:hypothetical protein
VRPDKVDQAIEEGRLSRAKEILRGQISSSPYDPELYERLGTVLLRMGDDLEAGKYLLLSDRRRAEHQAAIALVLSRYQRSPGNLIAAFPRAVRRSRWDDLSEVVRRDLAAAGVTPLAMSDTLELVGREAREPGPGCGGAIAIFLLLVFIGFTFAVYVIHFSLEN